jgi:hypothetical protein
VQLHNLIQYYYKDGWDNLMVVRTL